MSKATILIADNDPDYLATQKEFLEREGYTVITADTAAEARQLLEQERVDLAVLDIRLTNDDNEKDITGLILAKTLAPEIPKIILTRFPTYEAVREALGPAIDGLPAADAFVAKQEGLEAFLAAVKSALETAASKEAESVTPEERSAEHLTTFQRWRPMTALVTLLLALGAGILAMIYGDPRWLIGTVALAILAVFFIGISME